jgi:hypothetical protein
MNRTFTRFSLTSFLVSLARIAAFPVIAAIPALAFAQTDTLGGSCSSGTAQGLFCFGLEILNYYIVPIIFALAFAFFIFNVYRYFIAGGASEEKVTEGRRFVLWALVGFVLMFSLWGIINVFVYTLGFNSSARPALPTFGTPTNTASYSGAGSVFGNSTGTGSLIGGTTAGTGSVTSGTMVTAPNGVTAAAGSVPVGGNCGTNSQCQSGNSCNADGQCAATPANGAVANGGSCSGNENACSTGICNTATNLCQPIPGNGTVAAGGSCLGNESACVNGTTCNDDSDTCTTIAADGSIGQGGSCAGNENACANGLTCNTDDGDICEAVAGNGTVGQGGSCLGNENACQNGLTCADNTDTCQPDNGTNYDSTDTTCCDDGSDPSSGQCSDGTSPYSC